VRAPAAVLAAVLAAFAPPAGAADPPAPPARAARERIALERLRSEAVAEALVEAVQERICAALPEASGAEVLCPSDLAAAARLAQQAALLGECASDDCLKRLDAIRSADRRVTGGLERGESGLVLWLQLTGPAGAGPKLVERLPEDLDALVARIPAVVRKLFPRS
jgi:hypothetical protein